MLKLLIVDDEPGTREGLRYYFDWKKYGIEVIGEADDGKIALEWIQKEKPDIVLTDVKMPEMDGMQLANEIRRLYSHIKIVFISGYDEVSYLKSALKVEAIDYILKPVDLNEMAVIVEKVVSLIHKEKNEKKLLYEMNAKLAESMPMLREKFLMTLVRDGIDQTEKVEKRIGFLGLDLPNERRYSICIVSIDNKASMMAETSEKDKQLISFSIINICDELIHQELSGYIFENREGEYVCLLKLQQMEEEDQLYSLLLRMKDSIKQFLQISVTIGVGTVVQGLKNIVRSYQVAYENVNHRLFLGKNQVIRMDSLELFEEDTYRFDLSKMQQLSNMLRASDVEPMIETVDCIFDELSKNKKVDRKYCMNICFQLVLTAARQLMELKIQIEESRFQENHMMEQLFKLETLEDMKALMSAYLRAASQYIEEQRNTKSRNVIERVKEIIHKKYNQNISIQEIAKEVYLSTTYLCMVFKQETGETVNEYLTKTRIEKAKELLKDPRNKLYDICFEIGYTEAGYFSKLFKKHTGMSPTEYREKIL